jgi:hypothetical protein
MAIASIESLRNGADLKTGVSRNDLAVSDEVTVRSLNVGTAYQWSIAFKPEGMDGLPSAAVFTSTGTDQAVNKDPGKFDVDLDGPYLLRLVYTTPQITLNYVLAAGVFFNINGIKLIATAGARVPGSNDFSVASGTIAGITADMVAALNDAGNSFVGADLEGTDASPHVIINPTVETVPTGETVQITYSGTASDVTISDSVSEQFVRLRALTAFGALKLVAAGERYDTLKVPTDATFDGWADEQNFNLKALLGFAKTSAASGRVIYVDPETGDFTTIQAAIDHAVAQIPPPSSSQPWVVLVRPGVYQEDVAFAPYVHVFGWPGGTRTEIVLVQCASVAGHTAALPGGGEYICVADLELKQPPVATPVLTQSGNGSLTLYRCTTTGQISITGSGSLDLAECQVGGNGAAPLDYAVQVGASCSLKAERCVFTGQSIILGADLSQVTLDDCEIQASGTYAINTLASSTTVLFTSVGGLIGVNEGGTGTALNLSFQAHFSYLGDVSIDDTNIGGVANFRLGATAHGTITEHNTAVMQAAVPADTIFYDNVLAAHPVPLVASDVQEALDEIYAYAAAVRTLDDAYRSTGTARTIVADIGAVQIVDAVAPSDPIPPDNPNGNLNVVGAVKLGAINKPEITVDPNPFGNGPALLMGQEIRAPDAPYGGTALIMGNATGNPTDRNYNLRVGTLPADSGGHVGAVSIHAGNALAAIDAGTVFIQAGTARDGGGGVAGEIFLAPGESAAGTPGKVHLVDQATGTGATLTGSLNFTNPMVAGVVTFGTESGSQPVTFAGGEDLAAAHAVLAATGVVTTNGPAGNPIVLTTVSKGPTAEIYFLSESAAGVDNQLGGFNGATMAPGTWPDSVPLVGDYYAGNTPAGNATWVNGGNNTLTNALDRMAALLVTLNGGAPIP